MESKWEEKFAKETKIGKNVEISIEFQCFNDQVAGGIENAEENQSIIVACFHH